MTLKQAIEIVSEHQKWRRDQSVPPKTKMQNPTKVGEAIDVLLIVAKDYATIYNYSFTNVLNREINNMDRVNIKPKTEKR